MKYKSLLKWDPVEYLHLIQKVKKKIDFQLFQGYYLNLNN